jgi:GTP-binding protein
MPPVDNESARKLFAQPCDFIIGASDPNLFPPLAGHGFTNSTDFKGRLAPLPEVAFAGRSNVGKSSLINALVGRKNLARASQTPGRTQKIFFFNLARRLMLVDLPGYGHADAPKAEQERWNELVHNYLQQRPQLRCVFLLLDSRHGAKANDIATMQFLDRAAVSYQLVFTKTDQLRASDRESKQRQVEAMIPSHPAARPGLFPTAAEKGTGIEELRTFIAGFANEKPGD